VHHGSSGFDVSAARHGLEPEGPVGPSERWPDWITAVLEPSAPRQAARTTSRASILGCPIFGHRRRSVRAEGYGKFHRGGMHVSVCGTECPRSRVNGALRESREDCPKVRGIPRKSHGFRILCHKSLARSPWIMPHFPS
jgi:hypothetical protein